jgi:hypothetical protein
MMVLGGGDEEKIREKQEGELPLAGPDLDDAAQSSGRAACLHA